MAASIFADVENTSEKHKLSCIEVVMLSVFALQPNFNKRAVREHISPLTNSHFLLYVVIGKEVVGVFLHAASCTVIESFTKFLDPESDQSLNLIICTSFPTLCIHQVS